MVLGQILALIGVALSFTGSIYLAARVFKPLVPLKNVLQLDYIADLKTISNHYSTTSDTKKALNALISLLNIVLVDIETAEQDTSTRAKKGMFFLITGALFQALALVLIFFPI
jgi:hypothetical protein